MRNLEKGQHIFIAFQNGKAVLDSQLRPRMYTTLENADRWTPTVNKGKIEYVEYAPTLPKPSSDPLTLEELRGMSYTDWVWVVFPELPPEENCWYRASQLYNCYSHEHYKKTWIAYRRPPEGELKYDGRL